MIVSFPHEEQWKQVFSGRVEGRDVQVYVYGEWESVKVASTQKTTLADASIPHVTSAGDRIEIDGEDADELARNLVVEAEFSESAAREIARYSARPSQV